jgi:hypothetical protein
VEIRSCCCICGSGHLLAAVHSIFISCTFVLRFRSVDVFHFRFVLFRCGWDWKEYRCDAKICLASCTLSSASRFLVSIQDSISMDGTLVRDVEEGLELTSWRDRRGMWMKGSEVRRRFVCVVIQEVVNVLVLEDTVL